MYNYNEARSWLYDLYRFSWLYDLRWHITHWWRNDNQLKTNLPVGYYDKTALIQESLFAAVEDFISRDGEDALVHCMIDDDVMVKIIDILHFYRIRLPSIQSDIDYWIHECYGDCVFRMVPCVDRKGISTLEIDYPDKYTEGQRTEMRKKYQDLEKRQYEQIEEMLKKVIEIRPYLWV